MFPPGFLQETAQTLALLFPPSHIDCRRWVCKAQRLENLDLEAALFPPAPRDIGNYRFWGRKLRALREEYDSTEPTTIKQWIFDRRKPNQRYTFWIAVMALTLAVIFGLIQSVTGIIQAVATVRNSWVTRIYQLFRHLEDSDIPENSGRLSHAKFPLMIWFIIQCAIYA